MNKRYSFLAGAVVAGVAVGALLLGLPGVQAEGGVVAVHATDTGYQGVPANLPAGESRFSFTNDSKTAAHEMTLFRINDGVNDSFEQILAEDEAQEKKQAEAQQGGQQGGQNPPAEQAPPPAKMTYFGSSGAGPGESSKMDLIGNLPPGRYGLASFVPNDDQGTPDYKKGLKAEFTVK